jgi:DMSO/TMAO reductase YedYZ molybdopterin-dependent catalytic subunit
MTESHQERRQLENQMAQEGRLPSGQSLTLKFPILTVGPVPEYDLEQWSFRIFGEVEEPRIWSWEEFQALPRSRVTMDIHCVTRWSKFDTEWEGVSLATLVEHEIIKLKPAAAYVMQHCEYGYMANLPLSVGLADNFLLATHFNGEPLEPDHGYPLRGVIGHIPGREELKTPYFWKGGKWLRAIEFASADRLGYWEQVGFHNEADVWKEQRYGYVQNLL